MGGVVGCAIACVGFVEEDGKINIRQFVSWGVPFWGIRVVPIYMVLRSALFEFEVDDD